MARCAEEFVMTLRVEEFVMTLRVEEFVMEIEEYAHVFNRVRDKRDSTVFACAVVIEFSSLSHLPVEDKDALIEEATGKKINSDYSGWL